MAKQLNLLNGGQVISTALHAEMERSYLEYAMSVIVGRALPDVRDGLKPVHRRILYAMHELGLTPDRPFRKCARVVGDVLGKYHPHGDQAVYDALVRMVQDFSSRYPLLAGHGNFGSIDNDPPAAMRYTETRLAAIANQALLSNIGEATVDFVDNFDNSQQEPVVLPAQLPILLLNGCAGIAVGMATNVPPHNLGEIVDGLIALIDRPQLPDEKLWQIIPGPDFPTGGEIIEHSGIIDAYRTGRGTIRVRGVTKIERLRAERGRRRERTAITITELPFQVNKASWIEKVADLVNAGRIEGIADLRDESDRSGMRVVVELKRDTEPQAVLEQLYQQTPLQSNFGAIMLALVDNKPCQLSLREMLETFLQFREQTLIRQYNHDLTVAQRRLHLAEGLVVALNQLDLAIDILRNAPDGGTAKVELQQQLAISEEQADSILAMPLRRLTGLERQKLETEVEELRSQIAYLQRLLSDRHELMKALKKELRSLKRNYGDARRTRILSPQASPKPTASTKSKGGSPSAKTPSSAPTTTAELPEDAEIEITQQGYIQWRHASESKPKRSSKKGEDFPVWRQAVSKQPLIAITDSGKAHLVKVEKIPSAHSNRKTPLLDLLPGTSGKGETAIAHFFLPEKKHTQGLVLLTQQGRIKRLALEELQTLSNRGLSLLKIKSSDHLAQVYLLSPQAQELVVATDVGRLLRFAIDEAQLPVMGRTAQGNQVTRLRQNEQAIRCVGVEEGDNLLLVTAFGYAKRLPASTLRRVNRGDIGTQALQFVDRRDRLVGVVLAQPPSTEVVLATSQARNVLISVDAVPIWGKDGTGDRLPKLKADEKVLQVLPLTM